VDLATAAFDALALIKIHGKAVWLDSGHVMMLLMIMVSLAVVTHSQPL